MNKLKGPQQSKVLNECSINALFALIATVRVAGCKRKTLRLALKDTPKSFEVNGLTLGFHPRTNEFIVLMTVIKTDSSQFASGSEKGLHQSQGFCYNLFSLWQSATKCVAEFALTQVSYWFSLLTYSDKASDLSANSST